MMRPSTKAIAGALNRSRRSPRSSWCTWMSKSGYSSRAARGSSLVLPVVSTASAQRRSSSCMPPLDASRRRATSSRDSTSRPPPGKIRASTVGSLGVAALAAAAVVVSSMGPVYGLRGDPKQERPGFPGRAHDALEPGSELVTHGQHGRPARDEARREPGVGIVDLQVLVARVVHAAQVVDVGAVRVDAAQPRQLAGVVGEGIALGVAPVLVEQVEEVVDVQADNGLVVVEEARQFLLDADVELVHPGVEALVALGDLAAAQAQVLVALDERVERVDLRL